MFPFSVSFPIGYRLNALPFHDHGGEIDLVVKLRDASENALSDVHDNLRRFLHGSCNCGQAIDFRIGDVPESDHAEIFRNPDREFLQILEKMNRRFIAGDKDSGDIVAPIRDFPCKMPNVVPGAS